MTDDEARDRLWSGVWSLEYKATYGYESAQLMLRYWSVFDLAARLLSALFASTSAISGWALWSSATGRYWWAVFAGLAAVISIVDGVLASQEKLKKYHELSSNFVRLSESLKALLDDMRLNPSFDATALREHYESSRTRYAEVLESYPVDVFFTQSIAEQVQNRLNERREYANQNGGSAS